MNKNFLIFKEGFTLIELLVVISIIGILATLLISNVSGIRERARDVQRKSDLDQIKKALRMYYNDNNRYPLLAVIPAVGAAFTDATGNMVYMKSFPGDPSTGLTYTYSIGTCTDDFRIIATLENLSDSQITRSRQKCPVSLCGAPAAYSAGQYAVCAD